ncbi:MAG: sigma-70 family RNA polymerase sigma factor [Planctomycetota bacterium]
MSEVTKLLELMNGGDASAEDQLLRTVHDELKKIAASKLSTERPGHTLQTTALVNEAYLRLMGRNASSTSLKPESKEDKKGVRWDSRGHFFSAAAEAMRRILIDSARSKKRLKRGGDNRKVEMDYAQFAIESTDIDLESLDAALTKLESQNKSHAAVVKLRYFAGMTIEQAADALNISPATVKRSWAYAKVWLKREMESEVE